MSDIITQAEIDKLLPACSEAELDDKKLIRRRRKLMRKDRIIFCFVGIIGLSIGLMIGYGLGEFVKVLFG